MLNLNPNRTQKPAPIPQPVQDLIDAAKEGARGNFDQYKSVSAVILVDNPAGNRAIIAVPEINDETKPRIGGIMEQIVEAGGLLAFVSETWLSLVPKSRFDPDNVLAPRLDPQKREAVQILVRLPRNERRMVFVAEIVRGLDGSVRLDDWELLHDDSIPGEGFTPMGFGESNE